ncbi:MAG: hypothetical protein QM791_07955 [Ferruginibacter sp.]
MKRQTRLLLIAVVLFQDCFSQVNPDLNIARLKDSLETVIYKLKDSLRKQQYENIFLSNCYSADSTLFGHDSVVINYRARDSKLVKRIKKTNFDISDKSWIYEKVEYYNKFQLPEFVQQWQYAGSSACDTCPVFNWKIYSFERIEYDLSGRVSTKIIFNPPISRTRVKRNRFVYGTDGKVEVTQQSIALEKFWD